ncbi:MAG: 1-deoxy-D-xylulose-5-phosphate synthase, partial [Firmicutes bacterium]|nr:1-deoxy-D-xylulose-5-phosphate synthase [Bacillota bacterium]
MERTLLERQFPQELKTMSERDLGLLCCEIREFLLEKVSRTGGHLASNLGVVELSVALHKVFDSPKDKIIWDVGHQAYVHKILTGRAADFDGLRQKDGLSGFPKRCESEHDFYDSGHASTSISAAMGYAVARDLKGEDHQVIAVIGDGSLTGGVAFEALNNAGHRGTSLKVILNDNEMSIEGSSGSLSKYLSTLRTSQKYLEFKKNLKQTLKGKKVGDDIYHGLENLRNTLRSAVLPGVIFEELGFKYFGPVDGHNLKEVIDTLEMTKGIEGPVLIHVVTRKGKGYRNAENNPEKYHGIGAFDPTTGVVKGGSAFAYSKVFGNKMLQLAAEDDRVVAITAAMMEATGLARFGQRYP